MENIIIVQKTTSGSIGITSNVIFNEIVFNNGSITYNSSTGSLVFHEIGVYHVNWWIATDSVSSSNGGVFSLIDTNGNSIIGNTPTQSESFSGLSIVNVLSAPKTIRLANTGNGSVTLSSIVPVKAMLSVSMIEVPSGTNDTMYNFQMQQLANVLLQVIDYYSTNTIRVYVRGLYAIDGTPTSIFYSETGAGLFILTETGDSQAIPLNMITGVSMGTDSTYNPSITYLSPPAIIPSGWDTNVITSVYNYLPVGTEASVYFSIGNSKTGYIYKDEYGIIVVTNDAEGGNPIFIPATEASIIIKTET